MAALLQPPSFMTPPTTEEQFSQGSDRAAVASAFQLFRQRQDHHCSLAPWTSIPLKPSQYERFLEQLKQDPVLFGYVEDKLRFDYDPISMLLSVRMPTAVHVFFIAFITDEIMDQLKHIRRRGDFSAEFATKIANGLSSRMFLKEDRPDGDTRVLQRRAPDGQFHHRDAVHPGIILEVSYASDGKDLKKLAWDYIQCSNGDIKVVIGIDIKYDIKYSNKKEATLSVWRARFTREDGEEVETLDVEAVITSQAFRADHGSSDNSTNVLRLSLSDFATDELATNRQFGDSTDIIISYGKLAQYLNKAEERQASRELKQGAMLKREIRKRKRTSSPLDQLRSADEADRQNQEAKVEERLDAADDDFSVGNLVGVQDQALRRSAARQRLRGG